jgi:GNAT superfamily N-acetyltransferase
MTTGAVIRPPAAGDLEALVALCAAHAAWEQLPYDPAGKAERLAGLVLGPAPRIACLVADDGDGLVGYATWTYDASTWDAGEFAYLDCLYLSEAHRGRGLGRALLARVARSALAAGCSQVQWHTPAFNDGARRFYARAGATDRTKIRFFLEGPALLSLAEEAM